MQYPLISEYVEAIRMAEDNLDELTNLSSVLDDDGNPVMSSGNFAVVFKMKDRESGKLFALKCFTREQPAREENYLRITEELSYVSSPYILHVRYLPKELFVDTDQSNEDEFPVLVMDWVEGVPLDVYLRKCRNKLTDLLALSYKFCRMALWLWQQPFAHGDLKPDNILVDRKGDLTLVDYDGMYVPAMKGTKSRELGSANFRHPERTEEWFDKSIDDFPLALMALSLRAITLDPTLLNRYETKEALLFIEKDYRDIAHSKLYQELCTHSSDKVMVRLLSLFQLTLARVPISNQYTNLIDIHQEEYVVDNKYQINNSSNLNVDRTKLQQLTPEQLYRLAGENYKKGNYQQAFVYYKQSAEHGYAAAQYMFGYCYYEGKGVEQDYKQAVEWYRKAAEQGYAYAQYMLGYCYYAGKGVEQDYKQAVVWFRKAAGQSYVVAQYMLGYCYYAGKGVWDYKQAVAWFRKAAEQGYAVAQYMLGCCYYEGQGVEQDYKQAVAWYEQAAKQGNEKAKKNLKYILNPEITDEEYEEAITDEYGAKYTKGGLKLISVPGGLISYTIKEGTKVIGYYYIGAFNGCTSLQSVVIPDGVTKIGSSAFEGCTSLQSVDIPDSVTEISWDAFNGCTSLQSVVLPNGVTEIGGFYDCTSLQSVIIPDGVTEIEGGAFSGCTSLQSVVIPDSVIEIGDYAFSGCHQLTLNCKSPLFKVENNILYSKNGRLISCWSEDKNIELPYGITEIGESAFSGCTSLQSVDIPDGVTEIGDCAFKGCTSLQSVVIPDSVTKIGSRAFSGCTSLQSVVIPDSVTEISWDAFNGCTSLQSIVIPDGVTEIGTDAFSGCKSLQSVVIPDGVTEIGSGAFSFCSSLQSVVLPDSVTKIGKSAFNCCFKLALSCKSPLFKVENNILYSKNGRLISCWSEDKNIELPYGITEIGYSAFSGCTSLQSIVIPNGVTEIGSSAFEGCTSLQSIVIPNGVTEIGSSAFEGCTSLQSVDIPDGVTYIRDYAFEDCTSLQSIVIPDSVTYIGGFDGCTSLQSVVIPDSVTKIGYSAFRDCTSLQSVVLPDSVTEIGERAFRGCTSLQSIVIPNGVTEIGYSAFSGCTSLQSIVIPNGVTEIGWNAFGGCISLQSVTIPNSVTKIRGSAFSGCTSLQSVVIPDSVTKIGESAFSGCTSLQSVVIPESVTYIEDNIYIRKA